MADRQAALRVLGIYGQMDLSRQLEEPIQFKRVMLYLGYVTFVFMVVSTIYQTRIIPGFINIIETFEVPIPRDMLLFRDHGGYLALFIFGTLLLGLVLGHNLRKLFRYHSRTRRSFVFRYLTLPGIKTPYLNILEAVYYPLRRNGLGEPLSSNSVTEHLEHLENDGMDVTKEIEELIRRQGMILAVRCERQMRVISVAIALLIIGSIFFFLRTAYLPLFVLGDLH